MRIFTAAVISFIILSFVGCNPAKVFSPYPDCFEGEQSTVNDIGGCGQMFLYAMFDSSRAVTVSLDGKGLGLTTECQTFNIQDHPDNINIQYLTHDHHPDSLYFNFCMDFVPPPYVFGQVKKHEALSGKITVVVSKDARKWDVCEGFYTSVRLQDVYFRENKTGKQGPPASDTLIKKLQIVDEWVGFCGG